MAGENITSSNDVLMKVNLDYVCNAIRNPKPDIASLISSLRIIYALDTKKYSLRKKELPYFVCGIFTPHYRKLENFSYIEYFVVDIDKLADKELHVESVKAKIVGDERVRMCFVSPSLDGLKVMFKLKAKCCDASIYSVFYKRFVEEFSKMYSLDQVVDSKTCDASRACFISWDPDIYYNADSTEIDINVFIDMSDSYSIFNDLKVIDRRLVSDKDVSSSEHRTTIDDEVFDKIKAILNPAKAKVIKKKDVFVPAELEAVMPELIDSISATGVEIVDVIDIQYGKKLRVTSGTKYAEVNVFYGKRGFTVVKSFKNGTDSEFNQLMADYIKVFFDSR